MGVLITALARMGIPVTFFAGDDGAGLRNEEIEFVSIGGTHIARQSALKSLATGLINPRTVPTVRQWIAAHDTPGTVYHLHGWSKILSPMIFSALAPVKSRTVLHAHDYFNGCPNGGFFIYPKEKDCTLVPLSRTCLSTQCDKATYGHKLWRSGREALRRRLDARGGPAARILTLHSGMHPNLARGGLPADHLHAVRNPVTPFTADRVAAEENSSILYVGRISTEKGADLAARAARTAGVRITFAGVGAEVEAVRAQNPDARFTGWLDKQGLEREIRAARIAVMPSRWAEPFGLVALEAIGSGVPAVVNETALLGPEIDAAGFGRAVDTADVDAFAAVLSELSENDKAVAAMSRAGHAGYLTLCNTDDAWVGAIVEHYWATLSAAEAQSGPMTNAAAQ